MDRIGHIVGPIHDLGFEALVFGVNRCWSPGTNPFKGWNIVGVDPELAAIRFSWPRVLDRGIEHGAREVQSHVVALRGKGLDL